MSIKTIDKWRHRGSDVKQMLSQQKAEPDLVNI